MELLNTINKNLSEQSDEYAEYKAVSICVNPYSKKQRIDITVKVEVCMHDGLTVNRMVNYNIVDLENIDLENSKHNNEAAYYQFLYKFFDEVKVTEQNLINYIDVQYKWDY